MTVEKPILSALWEAATSPFRSSAERRFAKRAKKTLQQRGYRPDVQPSPRRARHGGGVGEGTLWASHNTPSSS